MKIKSSTANSENTNEPQSPAPVVARERVVGLDILRGVALLGILVANIHQMFQPFGYASDPVPVIAGERGVWIEWALFHGLVDMKFLTVFSLLFGVGFALQWQRSSIPAEKFRGFYLRRLAALAVFGLIHALLLYAADVLFIYATTGLALLFFRKLKARTLLMLGFGLTLIVLQWSYVVFGLTSISVIPNLYGFLAIGVGLWLVRRRNLIVILATGVILLTASVTYQASRVTLEGDGPAAASYLETLEVVEEVGRQESDNLTVGGKVYALPLSREDYAEITAAEPSGAEQAKIEHVAYKYGPGWLTIEHRIDTFIGLQIFTIAYLFWRTLGIFLIGAGLVKWGILDPRRADIWRKTAILGFAIGLPLTALATWFTAQSYLVAGPISGLPELLHHLSSLLLGFALAAAVMLWSQSDSFAWLKTAFAAAGRMALTNYIGQSAVMALIATWYGFGLYGDVSRIGQLGLAFAVFAGLMALSVLWLKSFRMGPLEWGWRCFNYLKSVPIARKN